MHEENIPEGVRANARLTLIVRALVDALPNELSVLLASPRFAESVSLLKRLRDHARTDAALRELKDEEATMLADRLLSRWTELDDKPLPPSAMLVRLEDPRRVALCLAGLEPGFEVIWEGATADPATPFVARILENHRVTARVRGRAQRDGQRCILVEQLGPS